MLERNRALLLAAHAMDDRDEEVRRIACDILGALGDSSTAALLVDHLSVAAAAYAPVILRALEQVGRRAHEPLERLAMKGEAPALRAAAIMAIGAAGLAFSCETIAPMLRDESREIRRATSSAIAEIARAAPLGSVSTGTVEQIVRQLWRERSASVMLGLIDAVEACGAMNALDVLLQRLPDMNPSVRARAIEVMAALQRRGDQVNRPSSRPVVIRD